MLKKHGTGAEALGLCSLNIILPQHIKHTGPGKPGNKCHWHSRQSNSRQHTAGPAVPQSCRQKPQLHSKKINKKRGQNKAWNGNTQCSKQTHRPVLPAVSPISSINSCRHTDKKSQQNSFQPKLQRNWKAFKNNIIYRPSHILE